MSTANQLAEDQTSSYVKFFPALSHINSLLCAPDGQLSREKCQPYLDEGITVSLAYDHHGPPSKVTALKSLVNCEANPAMDEIDIEDGFELEAQQVCVNADLSICIAVYINERHMWTMIPSSATLMTIMDGLLLTHRVNRVEFMSGVTVYKMQ